MKRFNVLIWHIHGSYLNYLVQAPHEFYLPVKEGRPEGYGGKGSTFDWPDNVHEVAAEEVRRLPLDLVVFQTPRNYLVDQAEILSPEQQRLPRIYLEHDPPREHPTNTRHFLADQEILLVHVTNFNRLMWDCGRTPTRVIEHGMPPVDAVHYQGELERGVVAVNGLPRRGRLAGLDLWQAARQEIPLDLIGMQSEGIGGLGDVPHRELFAFESHYRFFFSPIRYTSMPLAVIEAMMVGMPVFTLATTELPSVIQNGFSGFVSNDVPYLLEQMRTLIGDRAQAQRIGENARRVAAERFGISRFTRDWSDAFRLVAQ